MYAVRIVFGNLFSGDALVQYVAPVKGYTVVLAEARQFATEAEARAYIETEEYFPSNAEVVPCSPSPPPTSPSYRSVWTCSAWSWS
jgi:hypothetical protein